MTGPCRMSAAAYPNSIELKQCGLMADENVGGIALCHIHLRMLLDALVSQVWDAGSSKEPTRITARIALEERARQESRPVPLARPRRVKTRSSVVYFIEDPVEGSIKIGTAQDVQQRLKGLQTGHPRALAVLATTPGDNRLESELHERFAHLRIRGEWFRPEPDLLAFIDRLRAAAA